MNDFLHLRAGAALRALSIASAAVALTACEQNTYVPPPPPKVEVAAPVQKKITRFIDATGSTAAVKSVDLVARVQGFLQSINYKDGTFVKQGTSLFIIEPETYKLKLEQAQAAEVGAQATVKQAEADFKRQTDLVARASTLYERRVCRAGRMCRDGSSARRPGSGAAAGVAATAVAATGWIRVGDRWKYRLNYTGRGVGTVNVEIRDVDGSRVTEQITLEGFKGFRTERDVETKFSPTRFQSAVVFPGGYQLAEIAPYFPPGTELKAGQVWRELPGDFAIQPIGKRMLLSNVRVVGKEQVNVPAGRFEAWRIESVSESTTYNDQPVSVVCTFWYTPDMPRAVRVSVTTKSSYAVGTTTETYDLAAFERGQ